MSEPFDYSNINLYLLYHGCGGKTENSMDSVVVKLNSSSLKDTTIDENTSSSIKSLHFFPNWNRFRYNPVEDATSIDEYNPYKNDVVSSYNSYLSDMYEATGLAEYNPAIHQISTNSTRDYVSFIKKNNRFVKWNSEYYGGGTTYYPMEECVINIPTSASGIPYSSGNLEVISTENGPIAIVVHIYMMWKSSQVLSLKVGKKYHIVGFNKWSSYSADVKIVGITKASQINTLGLTIYDDWFAKYGVSDSSYVELIKKDANLYMCSAITSRDPSIYNVAGASNGNFYIFDMMIDFSQSSELLDCESHIFEVRTGPYTKDDSLNPDNIKNLNLNNVIKEALEKSNIYDSVTVSAGTEEITIDEKEYFKIAESREKNMISKLSTDPNSGESNVAMERSNILAKQALVDKEYANLNNIKQQYESMRALYASLYIEYTNKRNLLNNIIESNQEILNNYVVSLTNDSNNLYSQLSQVLARVNEIIGTTAFDIVGANDNTDVYTVRNEGVPIASWPKRPSDTTDFIFN